MLVLIIIVIPFLSLVLVLIIIVIPFLSLCCVLIIIVIPFLSLCVGTNNNCDSLSFSVLCTNNNYAELLHLRLLCLIYTN